MTVTFVKRLRELDWVEDKNIKIEYRSAEGRTERYAEIASSGWFLKTHWPDLRWKVPEL